MPKEIFKRVEKKYMLTKDKYEKLLERIDNHLEKDHFYKSTICNIYFDNDNNDLIVNSLEKPEYKEKVRLRSYNIPDLNDTVFLEIKNKYKGVVGKRRINMKLKDFYKYLETGKKEDTQIMNEIDYMFKTFDLKPKLFLAYDRTSYYDRDDERLRVTFDKNIRSRNEDLKLEYGDAGNLLFKDDIYILEIKTLGALPMWLYKALNDLKIYPKSFSKYGKIYEKQKEVINYV